MTLTTSLSSKLGFMNFMLLTLSLTTLPTSGITAEVYKWTDEDGTIHYSDIKPFDRQSTKLTTRNTLSSSATTSRKSAAARGETLSEEQDKQQKIEERAKRQLDEEAEIAEKCQAIRENIKTIEENSRIRVAEEGKYRFMTPEEIENKKAELTKTLQDHCQGK